MVLNLHTITGDIVLASFKSHIDSESTEKIRRWIRQHFRKQIHVDRAARDPQ